MLALPGLSVWCRDASVPLMQAARASEGPPPGFTIVPMKRKVADEDDDYD